VAISDNLLRYTSDNSIVSKIEVNYGISAGTLCVKNCIGIVLLCFAYWYSSFGSLYCSDVFVPKLSFCVATTIKQYTEEPHCELPSLRHHVVVEHCRF
jgi:hypothetical protein